MFMKKLFLIILILSSCEIFAQEDYNAKRRQQNAEISRLDEEIEQTQQFITKEKEKLYQLKLSWYNTCIAYLTGGDLKPSELDKLIEQKKKPRIKY